ATRTAPSSVTTRTVFDIWSECRISQQTHARSNGLESLQPIRRVDAGYLLRTLSRIHTQGIRGTTTTRVICGGKIGPVACSHSLPCEASISPKRPFMVISLPVRVVRNGGSRGPGSELPTHGICVGQERAVLDLE